jgi:hypothetical protein
MSLAKPVGLVALLLVACGDSGDPTGTTAGTGGSGGGVTSAGGGGASGCSTPLDATTLAELTFGIEPDFQAHPGDSLDLGLGVVECCYVMTPVDACAVFSVSPAGAATIDPVTGVLEIGAGTPSGTVLDVTADVEDGRRLVTTKVYVFTEADQPLVGYWTETTQLECGTLSPRDPELAIQELVFRASGEFRVTWQPFELYVDYWGTYDYDPSTDALVLSVTGGNFTPADVDGTGTATVQAGALTLSDVWLGTPQGGTATPACGHVFE